MDDQDITWFDHVRAHDGEHVGYIAMTADGAFVPHDLLWRPRGEAGELDAAETLLDEIGLSVMAETYLLEGVATPVRITELTRDEVSLGPVMTDDPGDIDLTRTRRLPLPTDRLGQPR
ncbi:hypothetical protein GCM10027418_26290 [Mariniluteicoccus endophyticus]